MKELLIGVDIGTGGVKGALFTLDGACLASAIEPSRLHRPDSKTVEEDPEFQFESACRIVRQCIKKANAPTDSIAAIGFDGQMAGVIGVGRDGHHVTPYDSWLDMRCAPQIKEMSEIAGDEVLRKTGHSPSYNHGPKILRWMKQYKAVYKKIHAFVQPGSYVAMRLCGLDGKGAFIDPTYLHFSGFADNLVKAWDPSLAATFGLDASKLPRIVDSHSIIGEMQPSIARKCGLKGSIPVIAGCGDTTASFLACGAVREGICVDVAGTASVFAIMTSSFQPDMQHRTLGCGHSAAPGLWQSYAYINGGGLNLDWIRNQALLVGSNKEIDLDGLNKMAEEISLQEDSPLFIPHLGGRVCPSQPELRGAWANLSWSHNAAHLYRAALEGVALEYGIYLSIVRELYPEQKLREVRITGGGEKSSLWNQMKSDVLGLPVHTIQNSEGAPMGVAMLAGFGAGLLKDLQKSAGQWIKTGASFRPRRKLASSYHQRLERYQELLKALNAFHEAHARSANKPG